MVIIMITVSSYRINAL